MISGAALCCAAMLLWWWPRPANEAGPVIAVTYSTTRSEDSESTHSEKPYAMRDAATYAAVRLEEIKAAPESWNNVWKWRGEFSAAGTPELQREVVALAREIGPDAFLSVLPQALASEDEWLRLDAARSIALLPDARLRDGVTIGVAAANDEVRGEVMDVVAQASTELRASLIERTLAAPSPDVVMSSIELVQARPSPELFTILIEGLRSDDAGIHAAVDDAISALIAERFHDYAAAAHWWAANRESFDETLSR